MNKRSIILLIIFIFVCVLICVIFQNRNAGFSLINENTDCGNKLLSFYEDKSYVYYLTCGTPEKLFIKFNGEKDLINIKDALKTGMISIEDIQNKIEYIKYYKDNS